MTAELKIPDRQTLHAFARAILNEPRDGIGSLSSPYDTILDNLVTLAEGQDRAEALRQDLTRHGFDAEATLEAIEAINPYGLPDDDLPINLPEVPELPKDAQLSPSLAAGAGEWVDGFIRYAQSISPMTPRLFHLSSALWLMATAIARRLVVPLAHEDCFPNLWVAWIAETTLWRKSTAMKVPENTAEAVIPFLMATSDTTREALITDLSGTETPKMDNFNDQERKDWDKVKAHSAQRGMMIDEMSYLLATMLRDYNAGMIEIFMRLYDCTNSLRRSTRSQGLLPVRSTYLSLLGASTPKAMSTYLLDEKLWSMGWWPRFALLTPDTKRPRWAEPTGAVESDREAIRQRVRHLYDRLPKVEPQHSPEALAVFLGTDVYRTWQRYNKALSYDLLTEDLDHRLYGTYGRLPTQAMKVATILAALDWPDGKDAPKAPRIEMPHLARAISITEEWRASTHRALTAAAESGQEGLEQRVLAYLGRYGKQGASVAELAKAMHLKNPEPIELAIKNLIKIGEVTEIAHTKSGAGGRPTTRYRLMGSDE